MVVVFGSINLDLVARVPKLPAPGETVAGTSFVSTPGGKGANQALAARQAGADVALFGAVGHDAFASAALVNLLAAGVDLAGVVRVDAPTGIGLINVDDRGENAITVVAGANGHARAAQVPPARLGVTTTLVVQLEVPPVEVAALARHAHAAGSTVILNAAPALPLSADLLRAVTVLVVSEQEAATCAAAWGVAELPQPFITAVSERFGCRVVVTLGAQGATTLTEHGFVNPLPPPVAVVDTTGAGDAFIGGMAAALDEGDDIVTAVERAVAAGAQACTYEGAQRGNQASS